jgi:transposase
VKAAVQAPPAEAGIDVANWNWKVVRMFIEQRFGHLLCRSSCLNYLHRLGFVLKRPKKHLLKADEEARKAFVAFYAALRAEAEALGAKIFFVDEAHFRADADLRGKWVLRGEPALVDSTSPRLGEKATYYSAVCLETGEVEEMEVAETCTAETSAAFLAQLRAKCPEPLIVIWDNAPAHHGEAIRTYLTTPNLRLRLVALPGYSPDFNADEAIWDWAREEVTANTCLGTKAKVAEKMGQFFLGLGQRTAEVQQRCRTVLQARADELGAATVKHVSTTPLALGLAQRAAPGSTRAVPRPPAHCGLPLGVLAQVKHVDSTLALL